MTSWDEYLKEDLLGSGNLQCAAIAGQDGEIWAQSDNWKISSDDVEAALKTDDLYEKGIHINNEHYIVTNVENDVFFGKKGLSGLIVLKTQQALLFGLYNERHQPGKALLTMENFAKFLMEQNF